MQCCVFKNTPFPCFKKSHFQNEAKCETFVVKMSFICIIIKNHFHINSFALSLALTVRFFGTRKWPIIEKALRLGILHVGSHVFPENKNNFILLLSNSDK